MHNGIGFARLSGSWTRPPPRPHVPDLDRLRVTPRREAHSGAGRRNRRARGNAPIGGRPSSEALEALPDVSRGSPAHPKRDESAPGRAEQKNSESRRAFPEWRRPERVEGYADRALEPRGERP